MPRGNANCTTSSASSLPVTQVRGPNGSDQMTASQSLPGGRCHYPPRSCSFQGRSPCACANEGRTGGSPCAWPDGSRRRRKISLLLERSSCLRRRRQAQGSKSVHHGPPLRIRIGSASHMVSRRPNPPKRVINVGGVQGAATPPRKHKIVILLEPAGRQPLT